MNTNIDTDTNNTLRVIEICQAIGGAVERAGWAQQMFANALASIGKPLEQLTLAEVLEVDRQLTNYTCGTSQP